MANYLVTLKLQLGEYEKHVKHLIVASTKAKAQKLAIIAECHGEPDFSEFYDFEGCNDVADFVYTVTSCESVEDPEFFVLCKYF